MSHHVPLSLPKALGDLWRIIASVLIGDDDDEGGSGGGPRRRGMQKDYVPIPVRVDQGRTGFLGKR